MNDSQSDTTSSKGTNENELNTAPAQLEDFSENDGVRLRLGYVRKQKNEIDELVESSQPFTTTVPAKASVVSYDLDPHGHPHNEGEASNHVSLFDPDEDKKEVIVSPRSDFSEQTSNAAPEEKRKGRFLKFRQNPTFFESSGARAAVADSSNLPMNKSPEDEVQVPPAQQQSPYVDDADEFLKEAYKDADDVDKLLAEIDAVWPAQTTPRKHLTSRPNRRPSRIWTKGEIISSSTTATPLGPGEAKASRSETPPNTLQKMYHYPPQSNAALQPESHSRPQFVIGDDFIQNVTKDRKVGYVGTDLSWELYFLSLLAVSIILIAIGLWKRNVLKYVFHLKLGKGFDEGVSLDYEKVVEEEPLTDSPRKEVALVQCSFTPPPVSSAPRTRRNSSVQIAREALPAPVMGRQTSTYESLPISVASTPISTQKSSRPKSLRRPTDLLTDCLDGEMINHSPSGYDFGSGAIQETAKDSTTSPPFGASGRRLNHKCSNSFDASLMGYVASMSGKGRGSSSILMDNDLCSASEVRSRGRQATTDLILTVARGNDLHITNLLVPANGTNNTQDRLPLPFHLRAALGDLLPPVAGSPLFPPKEGGYGGESTRNSEAMYDPDTKTDLFHAEESHYDKSLTTQNVLRKESDTGSKCCRTTSIHSHLSSSLTNVHNAGLLSTPSSTRSASSSTTSSPRGTIYYLKPPQVMPSCPQLSNVGSHDDRTRGRNHLRKDDQGGWQDEGWGDW